MYDATRACGIKCQGKKSRPCLVNDETKGLQKENETRPGSIYKKGCRGMNVGETRNLQNGESPMPICQKEKKKKDKTPSKWPDRVKKIKKIPESIRRELCRLLGASSVVAQFCQIFVLFATQKDVMLNVVVGSLRYSWIHGRNSQISCCEARPPRKEEWANDGLWPRDQSCGCSAC